MNSLCSSLTEYIYFIAEGSILFFTVITYHAAPSLSNNKLPYHSAFKKAKYIDKETGKEIEAQVEKKDITEKTTRQKKKK